MVLQNISVKGKLFFCFGALVVLILSLSAISYTNFQKLIDAKNWNTHTFEALAMGDNLIKSLINIETGHRGFALTGQENFLEPTMAGKEDFDKYFKMIKTKTSDNPTQ